MSLKSIILFSVKMLYLTLPSILSIPLANEKSVKMGCVPTLKIVTML